MRVTGDTDLRPSTLGFHSREGWLITWGVGPEFSTGWREMFSGGMESQR